ncbi:hypothetical protein LJC08_01940 [Methanimicrococcus sp. OttesenSCG-928-J09]|nr:hypothetical protein [Methanimicrococcus sp. OttesenSCG-928-J09]
MPIPFAAAAVLFLLQLATLLFLLQFATLLFPLQFATLLLPLQFAALLLPLQLAALLLPLQLAAASAHARASCTNFILQNKKPTISSNSYQKKKAYTSFY